MVIPLHGFVETEQNPSAAQQGTDLFLMAGLEPPAMGQGEPSQSHLQGKLPAYPRWLPIPPLKENYFDLEKVQNKDQVILSC
jgi:hypothetical protein